MDSVHLFEFETANLCYLNEGNCHIVLATNRGKVLRLLKGPPDLGFQNKVSSLTLRAVHFVNRVMVPLICENYNDLLQLVKLPEDVVNKLNKELFSLRPIKRRHKEISSQFAVLAPNYTLPFHLDNKTTVYCVEIKCKQGWMNPHLKPYGKCKFCLKQYLKLSERSTDSLSHYCPLDLFSGEKMRMKQAIIGLLLSPQNNFKIFRNGSIVYEEKSTIEDIKNILEDIAYFNRNFDTFLEFIVSLLLANQSKIVICEKIDKFSTQFLENLKNAPAKLSCNDEKLQLPLNCILEKILKLQLLEADTNLDEITKYNEYDYIVDLLAYADKHSIKNNPLNFIEHIDPIQKYMLSAVARDCSIMIGFSDCTHKVQCNKRTVKVGDAKVAYNIGVTDLEPKPASVITKQKKSQYNNLELYLNETNLCSDAFLIQPHAETREKQIAAWRNLILNYFRTIKQVTLDLREAELIELFCNNKINRKLKQEDILIVLEDMMKTGNAAPMDKSKTVWGIYWHSLDEWGNLIYNWASCNGMNNTVCTLFELQEGEHTVDEEFHGLNMDVLVKALKSLEVKHKCELIEFDDNQGVKFF